MRSSAIHCHTDFDMKNCLQDSMCHASKPDQVNAPFMGDQSGVLEQANPSGAMVQPPSAAATPQHQHGFLPPDAPVSRLDGNILTRRSKSPQYTIGNEQAIPSTMSAQTPPHSSPPSAATRPQDVPELPQDSHEVPELPCTPGCSTQPRRYRPAAGYEVSASHVRVEPGLT